MCEDMKNIEDNWMLNTAYEEATNTKRHPPTHIPTAQHKIFIRSLSHSHHSFIHYYTVSQSVILMYVCGMWCMYTIYVTIYLCSILTMIYAIIHIFPGPLCTRASNSTVFMTIARESLINVTI